MEIGGSRAVAVLRHDLQVNVTKVGREDTRKEKAKNTSQVLGWSNCLW